LNPTDPFSGALLGRAARRTPPNRRILVVDDDSDWREFLRVSLEEMGYEADEAASGEDALESLDEDDYGVMLLDLHMPGMSGEEVVEKLGAKKPRVVFLTSARADEVGSALRTGAHYYLPKGANRQQLELLLHSLEHSI
jgi:DNA-binding response OmpR family regulator